MLVHMATMVGFITNDTITTLELVKNKFSEFDLAVLTTVSLPFALADSYLVAKFSRLVIHCTSGAKCFHGASFSLLSRKPLFYLLLDTRIHTPAGSSL